MKTYTTVFRVEALGNLLADWTPSVNCDLEYATQARAARAIRNEGAREVCHYRIVAYRTTSAVVQEFPKKKWK
jgi:hypothetical protein